MEYGKQDARAAELNLETYDEDDMFVSVPRTPAAMCIPSTLV